MPEVNATVFRSFEEFWPYYVSEHSVPACRTLHFIGTTLALFVLIAALMIGNYWLLLAVPVVGYGLAWVGHFFIEKNRPATFKYPLWSLFGDVKMYGLILTGRMAGEVQRVRTLAK